ncbi:MAG TPA: hypothetical protein VIF57_00870 [Polyangia bacterium]
MKHLAAAAMVLASVAALAAPARAADDATAEAKKHYERGLDLFDKLAPAEALVEFTRANELKPRPATLFMMAQCEFLIGRLKEASAHYQRYYEENPNGEFAELARDRVVSISRRPATLVVNTVPEDVTVRIAPAADTGTVVVTGQAPNNFSVPRGKYRLDVSRPNYLGQTRIVDVDVGETKPLFFKLDPIPARLEIETKPPGATLYVNGNRARNPYRQDIPPGHVEIFAEATDYVSKTVDLTLAPGERRLLTGDNRFRLQYVQRSGRPELLVASVAIGGALGAGAVVAGIGDAFENPSVATVLLVGGGFASGAVVGGLVGSALSPRYIPDNQALFILGGMWIGTAEGLTAGIVVRQVSTSRGMVDPVVSPCPGPDPCRGSVANQLRAGFVGSLPGLAVGLTAGALTAKHAPNYGRVALIQSAALGGLALGGISQIAFKWKPYGANWEFTVHDQLAPDDPIASRDGVKCIPSPTNPGDISCAVHENSVFDLAPGALIGLNVGLAAGLLGAYLPDQSRYGPSWKRILLIDLGAGAGALAGGVGACVALVHDCLTAPTPGANARAISAWAAIAGGAIGLAGGVLLTRHYDDDIDQTATTSPPPLVTYAPVRDVSGAAAPGVAALGFF